MTKIKVLLGALREEAKRFQMLGVFPYDFSAEAAKVICGVNADDLRDWHERSLIQVDENDRRFLISLLREYAWSSLDENSRIETEVKAIRFFKDITSELFQLSRINLDNKGVRTIIDLEWKNIFALRLIALAHNDFENFVNLGAIAIFLGVKGFWMEQLEIWNHQIKVFNAKIDIDNFNEETLLYIYWETEAIYKVGTVYFKQGKWEDALKCYQEALDKREIAKFDTSDILFNMGVLFSYKGDNGKALDLYKKSVKIKNKNNDKLGAGGVMMSIGNLYFSEGDYDKAIEYYDELHGILLENKNDLMRSQLLMNLGNAYSEKGQWELALSNYKESLQIVDDIGDRHTRGAIVGNMGVVFTRMGNDIDAVECFEENLAIKVELGDLYGEGMCLNLLGTAYYEVGRYEESAECLMGSIKILSKFDVDENLIITISAKSMAAMMMKNGYAGDPVCIVVNKRDKSSFLSDNGLNLRVNWIRYKIKSAFRLLYMKIISFKK